MGDIPRLSVRECASEADWSWLADLWRENWGDLVMVTRGRIHRLRDLRALIAWDVETRVGAATYCLEGAEVELTSLNAVVSGKGIGSALMSAVEDAARRGGATRLWLITTNDNLDALRFYQRRGYRLVRIDVGAVDEARRIKPTIPERGAYGIPIHDEIELAKQL
jgi:GNAT superfamily N-acetyltransferase